MKYRLEILEDMLEVMPLSKLELMATIDAIEFYKKAIPMKATLDICPICEGDLKIWDDGEKYNYCPKCGQRIA